MSNWYTRPVNGFIDYYVDALGDALYDLVSDGADPQEVIKMLRRVDLADCLMGDLVRAEEERR